jgi:hypothetical protein
MEQASLYCTQTHAATNRHGATCSRHTAQKPTFRMHMRAQQIQVHNLNRILRFSVGNSTWNSFLIVFCPRQPNAVALSLGKLSTSPALETFPLATRYRAQPVRGQQHPQVCHHRAHRNTTTSPKTGFHLTWRAFLCWLVTPAGSGRYTGGRPAGQPLDQSANTRDPVLCSPPLPLQLSIRHGQAVPLFVARLLTDILVPWVAA